MMNELNALLESAKELPKKELGDGEFARLPDGEYDAVIFNVKFTESKTSGNLMFVWEFIISEGQYAKFHEWKYSVLNSPEAMQRLITDLTKFGVNTESIETIEKDFDTLLDVPVKLTIITTPNKTNPAAEPYRNISVKPCNS